MDAIEHVTGIGKIIGNLHALELLLCVFLCKAKGENPDFPKSSTQILPENHLTNFMTLGALIDCYNSMLAPAESMFAVNRSVVTVRDAIAHGRLTSQSPSMYPLTLYKFGRSKSGILTTEIVEVISKEWLDEKLLLLRDQIEKLPRCAAVRGYKSL
jgi:hypothetical protein